MVISPNQVADATARYAADSGCATIVVEDCRAGISVQAHGSRIGSSLKQVAQPLTSEELLASLNNGPF